MASSVLDRIARKVVAEPNGCLLWVGATNGRGYGQVYHLGKVRRAHVVAYEQVFGAVPEGLELGHTCGQSLCANPHHVVPMSHGENERMKRSRCKRGHSFTHVTRAGYRACRTCTNELQRERRRHG